MRFLGPSGRLLIQTASQIISPLAGRVQMEIDAPVFSRLSQIAAPFQDPTQVEMGVGKVRILVNALEIEEDGIIQPALFFQHVGEVVIRFHMVRIDP
jgi:hypothetical protein